MIPTMNAWRSVAGRVGGGGGGGVQLAQVYSPHSDGLIPVRATAAQCPSGGLKIGAEAKNSAALCSLKAALTWPRPSRANLHHTFLFLLKARL